MKNWEFLIQKEGDRTWLPIETQTVEILEGRYRIVVRTQHLNQAVEVRVGYLAADENPPKRRVQQRTRHTNDQGLMPVVAFTRFRSGIWEIRCGLPTDGHTDWQAKFELQVLPRDGSESVDWEPAEDAVAEAAEPIEAEPIATEPIIPLQPQVLEQASNPVEPLVEPLAEPQPDQAQPDLVAPSLLSAEEFADLAPPSPDRSPVETWAPTATTSPADMSKLRQLAEQMSQTVVDSMLEFTSGLEASAGTMGSSLGSAVPGAAASEAAPPADPTPDSIESIPDPLPEVSPAPPLELPLDLNLSLRLAQDTIVLDRSAPQALVGQVQGPADEVGVLPAGSLLCLELRDPATAQCIAARRLSLDLQPLPADFSFELELPADCGSQLLLGSLQLQHQGHAGPATVLATQTFTAVAPVSALLDAVNPQLMDPIEDLPGPEQSLQQTTAEGIVSSRLGYGNRTAPEIDTELLKLLDNKEREPQYRNTRNRVLPPKLGPMTRETGAAPGLDLPSFAARSIRVPAPPPFQEEDLDLAVNEADPADLADDLAATPIDATPIDVPEDSMGEGEAADGESPTIDWGEERAPEAIAAMSVSLPEPQVDEDAGFLRPDNDLADQSPTQVGELRPLNLEARFLDRLNAFAEEDAAQRREQAAAAAEAAEAEAAEAEAAIAEPTFTDSSTDYPTWPGTPTEIVVDDEPIAPSALSWLRPTSEPVGIPDDMPIPEPELAIARQELVAGQRLEVELRVAAEPTRLCAKIWLTDCQTRTLLMEPMLVTDFIHGFDEVLETCVDMNVPLGCMELQVEAIAIEPISQRESRKVVLRRSVLPPDFLEGQDDSIL
jgi:hypothetical protein